jgi:hypothetical protein
MFEKGVLENRTCKAIILLVPSVHTKRKLRTVVPRAYALLYPQLPSCCCSQENIASCVVTIICSAVVCPANVSTFTLGMPEWTHTVGRTIPLIKLVRLACRASASLWRGQNIVERYNTSKCPPPTYFVSFRVASGVRKGILTMPTGTIGVPKKTWHISIWLWGFTNFDP